MKSEAVFARGMICCKPMRVAAGMACKSNRQWACAWHHVDGFVRPHGLKSLQAFAEHLLGIWSLHGVHWVFNASGEISALAMVCARRYVAMPTQEARDQYRADVTASTSPEFAACFDVLCEAARERP